MDPSPGKGSTIALCSERVEALKTAALPALAGGP
jgi:hypothetical protein